MGNSDRFPEGKPAATGRAPQSELIEPKNMIDRRPTNVEKQQQ